MRIKMEWNKPGVVMIKCFIMKQLMTPSAFGSTMIVFIKYYNGQIVNHL
jgi:hypothetical protein